VWRTTPVPLTRPGPRHGGVPCRHPKPRVKAKSSLSERNYLITMHHQAGVNYENFIEVKFQDILLTGMGHRDRQLNRDSPGQTGTYGRSNLNLNQLQIHSWKTIYYSFFSPKCRPGALSPPCRGPEHDQLSLVQWVVVLAEFHCVCISKWHFWGR